MTTAAADMILPEPFCTADNRFPVDAKLQTNYFKLSITGIKHD